MRNLTITVHAHGPLSRRFRAAGWELLQRACTDREPPLAFCVTTAHVPSPRPPQSSCGSTPHSSRLPPRRRPAPLTPGPARSCSQEIIFSSYFNLLLLCVPLGWASAWLHWGAVATFTLNFLALVPLALILGDITEDLAVRFGDVVGGLINATFGERGRQTERGEGRGEGSPGVW